MGTPLIDQIVEDASVRLFGPDHARLFGGAEPLELHDLKPRERRSFALGLKKNLRCSSDDESLAFWTHMPSAWYPHKLFQLRLAYRCLRHVLELAENPRGDREIFSLLADVRAAGRSIPLHSGLTAIRLVLDRIERTGEIERWLKRTQRRRS